MDKLGPVHWGSFPGEYLELAMAVMVAQDHPDTMRRTPASGDGGIDLMIPDGEGYEVRQVKRFTGRIGSNEQRQITNSWETLRNNPRLSRPITAYAVVAPVDLTPDEQDWFDQLVKEDSPWPARWLGEVHWHDLASRHPHVIDYFFGGGRDKIARRSRALQAMSIDPMRPLEPADVAGAIGTMVAALNNEDPHYRYEVRTSARPPTIDEVEDDAVLAQSQSLSDGRYLTISVHPKHLYALQDAPIQGTIKLNVPEISNVPGLREKIEGFQHFGRALDLPEGLVSFELAAPGGLGGEFSTGTAWIGPAVATHEVPPVRFVVVSPKGEELAELEVELHDPTSGPAGGAEVQFRDRAGVFTGVLRMNPPTEKGARLNIQFSLAKLVGRPVVEVLPAARLVAAFESANELQVRPQYGKQVWARTPIQEPVGIGQGGLRHLEDLAVAQQYASGPVLFPDEVDPAFAAELNEYVRLLSGEVITGTWDEATLGLSVPRTDLRKRLGEPAALAMDREVSTAVGDTTIELGSFTTILHAAVLALEQPDDEFQVRLVPAEDRSFTKRAGPLARSPD